MPCERALYDCRFLAWLIVMKFVMLVPLDRIRLLLRSQGVDIAEGTLVHLAERVQPRLAVLGAHFIQALYELEEEAEQAGLEGADRVAFRQRRSRRVLRRFRQWLDQVVARPLPPSDPVRKVAKY